MASFFSTYLMLFNLVALRMAKAPPWRFDHAECNRVKTHSVLQYPYIQRYLIDLFVVLNNI